MPDTLNLPTNSVSAAQESEESVSVEFLLLEQCREYLAEDGTALFQMSFVCFLMRRRADSPKDRKEPEGFSRSGERLFRFFHAPAVWFRQSDSGKLKQCFCVIICKDRRAG